MHFFDSTFKNSLTFALYANTMPNGTGEVAEVLYYSRDSYEIVRKYPHVEVTKFTNRDWTFWDVFLVAPHGRSRTLRPAKGLPFKQ